MLAGGRWTDASIEEDIGGGPGLGVGNWGLGIVVFKPELVQRTGHCRSTTEKGNISTQVDVYIYWLAVARGLWRKASAIEGRGCGEGGGRKQN